MGPAKKSPIKPDNEPVMLVMPAVHEFDGVAWGWHKLGELIEAVNNILATHGLKESMTTLELVKSYRALTPSGEDPVACAWFCRDGRKRLERETDLSREDVFVPAVWGVSVVKAATKGVPRVERNVGKKTCTGITLSGQRFRCKV